MAHQRKSRFWQTLPFPEKLREGMRLNKALLRGRTWTWVDDQFSKLFLRKEDDLDYKQAMQKELFRSPLPPPIRTLYRRTVKDVRRVLHPWRNSWVLPPFCSLGRLEKTTKGTYSAYRHEIQISHTFHYWNQQVSIFLRPLHEAIRSSQRRKHIDWVTFGKQMLQDAAHHKACCAEQDETLLFSALDEEWQKFLQELPSILEQYASSKTITHEMALWNWYEELEKFREQLQRAMRHVFIHEIMHSYAQWTELCEPGYKEASYTWHRPMSFEGYQENQKTTSAFYRTHTITHREIHEAITEWIAARIHKQLYGGRLDQPKWEWRGLIQAPIYPAWIIQCIALAFDHYWENITDAIPALKESNISNTVDFLYTAYFADTRFIGYFKEALTWLNGDPDAFETLSKICEHFTTRPWCEDALLKESFDELRELVMPILDEAAFIIDDSSQEANE